MNHYSREREITCSSHIAVDCYTSHYKADVSFSLLCLSYIWELWIPYLNHENRVVCGIEIRHVGCKTSSCETSVGNIERNNRKLVHDTKCHICCIYRLMHVCYLIKSTKICFYDVRHHNYFLHPTTIG